MEPNVKCGQVGPNGAKCRDHQGFALLGGLRAAGKALAELEATRGHARAWSEWGTARARKARARQAPLPCPRPLQLDSQPMAKQAEMLEVLELKKCKVQQADENKIEGGARSVYTKCDEDRQTTSHTPNHLSHASPGRKRGDGDDDPSPHSCQATARGDSQGDSVLTKCSGEWRWPPLGAQRCRRGPI